MKKTVRVRRPEVEHPSVLVLHQKHGQQFFYVPDEESLFRAALEVVEGRSKVKWWYYEPERPTGPSITKEEVEALPEAVKEDGRRKLRAHTEEMRAYQSDKEGWDELQRILREKDGRGAWRHLRDRSDGEYERVTLECFLRPGEYRG